MFKELVTTVLGIALVGLLVYLIERYIPMPEIFKTAIRIIVVIAVIYYLIAKYL